MLFSESCVLLHPHTLGPMPPTPMILGPVVEDQLQSPSFFPSFFRCYFLTPIFFDFQPNMTPSWTKLAPISPSFALLFQITFPTRFPTSFWTDFGPQIDFKIDQKSIKKFFQNQPTNKSYFSFIFNQISKTISCSSKMVDFRKSFQNLVFL